MKIYLSAILVLALAIQVQAQCWNVSDSTYSMGFETNEIEEFESLWTIIDKSNNDTTWMVTEFYPNTGE